MSTIYTPLEQGISQGLTANTLTFDANSSSLSSTTSFLYTFAIMIIVVAAATQYVLAGGYRIEASERGERKSHELIKRATFGLLGVLSLFVILYTVDRDLLRGDVGLAGLRTEAGATITARSAGSSGSSGVTQTCDSVDAVKASLSSPGGVCGNTQCTALSGCNYQQYLPLIRQKATSYGVDPKVVVVVMCTESRGTANARNRNPNGTFDCGLMQINQSGDCSQSILDPATNIDAGIAKIKQKMSTTNRIYGNIPPIASLFASYNCCSNGVDPNAASVDCTQANGFPFTPPKWACPINPGSGQFNMCSVESYVCSSIACLATLQI